jgi:spore coat polysaccharide biosynthesis protein SpsF
MLNAMGVVQACFPAGWSESFLRRRFGDRSLVQWIIRRVTDSARLDGVVVLTRPGRSHEMIQDLVPMDVPVISAEGPDLLAQFTKALEDYPSEAIVRVRADSPFVDPTLIDRLIVAAESKPECDYASYCCHGGRPAVLTPVGLFAEWVRVDALRRAARLARDEADRNAVTSYVFSHPERFRVRLLPAPERIDRDDVRLKVDRDEDWEHALTIIDALGPEGLDWQRIAELLDHQPQLRSRMAALNRAG